MCDVCVCGVTWCGALWKCGLCGHWQNQNQIPIAKAHRKEGNKLIRFDSLWVICVQICACGVCGVSVCVLELSCICRLIYEFGLRPLPHAVNVRDVNGKVLSFRTSFSLFFFFHLFTHVQATYVVCQEAKETEQKKINAFRITAGSYFVWILFGKNIIQNWWNRNFSVFSIPLVPELAVWDI